MRKLAAIVMFAAALAPFLAQPQGRGPFARRRGGNNDDDDPRNLVKADTGRLTGRLASRILVLTFNGGRLDWSAKRNVIAFDRMAEEGYCRVWLTNPDGSGERCLTCG